MQQQKQREKSKAILIMWSRRDEGPILIMVGGRVLRAHFPSTVSEKAMPCKPSGQNCRMGKRTDQGKTCPRRRVAKPSGTRDGLHTGQHLLLALD